MHGDQRVSAVAPEPGGLAVAYYDLTCQLLGNIGRSTASTEPFNDIEREFESLRRILQAQGEGDSILAAQRLQDLLNMYKERLQNADQERTERFREILLILNEALTCLNSGGERCDIRMKHLENSLQSASKIDDLRTLKIHLSNVLQFVRDESEKELQKSRSALQALGTQLQIAHQASTSRELKLASREDGLAYLANEMAQRQTAETLYAGLFVIDALRAVRSRHGTEVSDSLFAEIGKTLIGQILPQAQMFEWSSDALLMVWCSKEGFSAVSDHVENALSIPLESRAFVGTRVANFSISVRALVLQVTGGIAETVLNLDHFATAVPP